MSALTSEQERKKGYIYATLAYLGWGFFPIYWKFLKHVPSLEILSHRVIWAFLFYSLLMALKSKGLRVFWPASRRALGALTLAATLLMLNWFIYIYAVNSNQIVESSLGYFINPLVNIALGVFLLKERLSLAQKWATALATIGVLIISWDQGHLPWIALVLAFTFSFYGLLKKLNPVPGLDSNQYESMIMLPVAVAFLYFQPQIIGHASFAWAQPLDVVTLLLLVAAGAITGFPLVFFAEAAQRLPYYLLGFFQFLAPSLQFMSGVLLFGEELTPGKLLGFLFIWTAGGLIVFNNWWSLRRLKKVRS